VETPQNVIQKIMKKKIKTEKTIITEDPALA